MKTKLLFSMVALAATTYFSAQNVSVFSNVPFYSMYHYLGEGESLPAEAYSQIPAEAIRMHAYERDVIARKLSVVEIATLGSEISMNIDMIAACDNYDRFAGVSLALVPKGSTSYTWDQTDVKRIELGRIITPFMNKNVAPTSTPYSFKLNNFSKIIHNPTLAAAYDFWIEFRADGYSAAANNEVAGCAGRTDVFRGNLEFVSTGTAIPESGFFLPLSYRENLNNYNATDVPGTTTRIVNFSLSAPVNNAKLFLSMSNHGANTNGEEYKRRQHFVYLDDQMIFQFKPGGKSCEPYRVNNTQGNGIYGSTPKHFRSWLSFNNWCPGDAIPNREIDLGNLTVGNHTIKITVPDAVFVGGQGNFPISMYIQNSESGQIVCAAPTNFKIAEQIGNTLKVNWEEEGNSTNWETVSSRKNIFNTTSEVFEQNSVIPEAYRNNLTQNWYYEMYVRSKCTNDFTSEWVGPVYSTLIKLGTEDTALNNFSVYPNPAKDVINIKADDKIKKIDIYSLDGKKIAEETASSINVSKYSQGNYLMMIYFENGKTSTQKFSKH